MGTFDRFTNKKQQKKNVDIRLKEKLGSIEKNKKGVSKVIVFNCNSCGCLLSVSGKVDCMRAICPECEQENRITASDSSSAFDNAQKLDTFVIAYTSHLDETRFATFEQRCQVVNDIHAEFMARFEHLINKKPSTLIDKSSSHISLIYETIYIAPHIFNEIKHFLEMAFKPFESEVSNYSYPEWSKLKNDLSLLHPLMLKQLRTTMCFIVLDKGKQHVATIVRVPSSEFPNTIKTTQMRLYIGLCRTKHADMFFFYPVIADIKNLWWTETWIFPYDDEMIDPGPYNPLSKEARKRLSLLLNQEFSYALIVDENNKLRCDRKITFTKSQKEGFPLLNKVIRQYKGNRISLAQAKNAIDDYLTKIDELQLQQQFELLLREE